PAGEHDPDPQAGEAAPQPDAQPQAHPEEVPVLAVVHRQRLLERRAEVSRGDTGNHKAHRRSSVGSFVGERPRVSGPRGQALGPLTRGRSPNTGHSRSSESIHTCNSANVLASSDSLPVSFITR